MEHVLEEQMHFSGLPWWLNSKETACNVGDAGDAGSILGL